MRYALKFMLNIIPARNYKTLDKEKHSLAFIMVYAPGIFVQYTGYEETELSTEFPIQRNCLGTITRLNRRCIYQWRKEQ